VGTHRSSICRVHASYRQTLGKGSITVACHRHDDFYLSSGRHKILSKETIADKMFTEHLVAKTFAECYNYVPVVELDSATSKTKLNPIFCKLLDLSHLITPGLH
jgi:hypothetical protein